MRDYKTDYQQSLTDLRKALPLLQRHCPEFGPGPFTLVNEHSGSVASDLDVLAGFDIYQHWRSGMRGIAGRAQRCDRPFRTFTIRTSRPTGAQTEYEKRLWAIRHQAEGAMYPHWTMQSYSSRDGDHVLAVGLARTEELILFIEAEAKRGQPFKPFATDTGETYIRVAWDYYRRSGGYFFEYAAPVVAKERAS